jgi:hydrogenase-4 component B
MSYYFILTAMVLAAASGVPGLWFARTSPWGQRLSLALMTLGALAGTAGAVDSLFLTRQLAFIFPWQAMGDSLTGLDPLSAFFLIPIFVTSGLATVYGAGYWPAQRHPRTSKKLRFFWGLLVGGMALVVISKHALAFLFGWEVMALSAFFLVTTEDHHQGSRRAGWTYFISMHISLLALLALFALWRHATGSFALQPAADIPLGVLNVLFFLALLSFGLKAGVMPLHFWLPGAHANAPTHVSALLSGIVLKIGIYGLLRFLSLLPNPPAIWGTLILALGAVSGLLGVVFALAQHDLKRFLAYHSIENIGIILMGLGLAMLGRTYHLPALVVLGLAGCLLHVWNHSLFKSLLFLAAGSVVQATHTRQIDNLGGLAKTMPWTAAMFLVGSVAICGLPPLNGFISEFFIYLGLLRGMTSAGTGAVTAALVAPLLAMIGALAVACFVKVYGTLFLGNPRTPAAAQAGEAPWTMRLPMLTLAAFCLIIGLAPFLLGPVLDAVVPYCDPTLTGVHPSLWALAPLGTLGAIAMVLFLGLTALVTAAAFRGKTRLRAVTWDCGYAAPNARMQYTASSFAQPIMAMFNWVLKPSEQRSRLELPFPQRGKMQSHVDDVTLERFLEPTGRDLKRLAGWFRRFQQGLTQHYVLYILITMAILLSTLLPLGKIIAWLASR